MEWHKKMKQGSESCPVFSIVNFYIKNTESYIIVSNIEVLWYNASRILILWRRENEKESIELIVMWFNCL